MKLLPLSFLFFASISFASDFVYCTANYGKTFLITDCHEVANSEDGENLCRNWIDMVGTEAFVQTRKFDTRKRCKHNLEKVYSKARNFYPIQIVNADRYHTTAFSQY